MATLVVRLAARPGRPAALAVPVREPAGGDGDAVAALAVDPAVLPPPVAEAAAAFLADVEHSGAAGTVQQLAQPLGAIREALFTGVGDGSAGGWRAAGAAIVRGAMGRPSVALPLPPGISPEAVGAVTEGALLGAYRYRLANEPDDSRKLRTVTLVVADPDRYAAAHRQAVIVAEATCLARDLTNTPGADKSPGRLAGTLARTAGKHGLRVTVREPDQLAAEGFGGILAVGGGSARGPRLVELHWAPPGATRHVVLIGKGITFDTGGIDLKPAAHMLLMRKDMGGAASVAAAAVGAARLDLPLKVTILVPLAENMVGADSYRPGDVVRHYGGLTSEVLNTDAEGRMVLADALAYAVRRLDPDVVVDLATLTGASHVALGKRTAALFCGDDVLARELTDAAGEAGERMWRLPLSDEYTELLDSDVADLNNAPGMRHPGTPGAITAALFLREFLGDHADRWAHIDMSNVSWADRADAELAKHATGWGVRTLLRWLAAQT